MVLVRYDFMSHQSIICKLRLFLGGMFTLRNFPIKSWQYHCALFWPDLRVIIEPNYFKSIIKANFEK